jgi:alkanesulfonate monooxygenase SsuD/methylene tetrahydromethanopterin reductase-like flavin-dependent oxidoreductase (luciferase family)
MSTSSQEVRVAGSGVGFDMQVLQEVSWPVLLEEVRYLEGLGLGTVWLAARYAWPPRPGAPVLEAWTALAALATRTMHGRLGMLVSNVAVRHPSLLAEQAATVDHISGGRLELGLGSAYFGREHAFLGIPHLAPGGRIQRLREAVQVIDTLLRVRHLSYHGQFYHLDDAPLMPPPVQQPRAPLTIAAVGRKALWVVAEYADTWVWEGGGLEAVEQPLEGIRARNRLLDEYCEAMGRDPRTLERAYYAGWA